MLGSDGVIGVFTPIHRGSFRCVDGHTLEVRGAYTVEAVLDEIAAMPEPEQVEAEFDFDRHMPNSPWILRNNQALCGEFAYMPARLVDDPQGALVRTPSGTRVR